jgi:hypothetical protein
MNGRVYQPPVDSREEQVAGFNNWSQTVSVQSVDPDRLTLNIVDPNPDAVRVTVTVRHGQELTGELSWYRFRPLP